VNGAFENAQVFNINDVAGDGECALICHISDFEAEIKEITQFPVNAGKITKLPNHWLKI
jgi:hypothetical protein